MKKLLLFFVLLTLSDLVFAANKYVRQGAAGTGTGADWTNAYTTLPAGLTRGDVYYIADGTYSGYTFDDANSGTTVITIKKATIADHGTETGWVSTYGDGQAVFGGINIYNDYYTFDGQVRNTDWRSGGINQYGISFSNVRMDNASGTGGDNITFQFVDIHGGGRDTGDGDDVIYTLTGGTNITFTKCALRDSDRTIFLTRGTPTNWLIEYSYIARNASTPAVHSEAWSFTDGANVIIRYNVLSDVEGTAVFAGINGGTMNGFYVYGNTFGWSDAYLADTGRVPGHNSGVAGIINIINDASNDNFGNNVKFYNNTIVKTPGTYAGIRVDIGTGNEVRNNLWYDTVRMAHNNVTLSNNFYFSIDISIDDDSPSAIVCSTGCNHFTNLSTGDFTLSSALSGATTLSSPYNIDPNGVTRGADGTFDIGAFEFGGADTTPPTVSSTVPTSGATSVSTGTAISITFSEPLNPSTVTTSAIGLINQTTLLPKSGTVSYNSLTNTATFTPSSSLDNSTVYRISLLTGALGIKDVAGNGLAVAYTSDFTTVVIDTTPPTVSGRAPSLNGATRIPVNVVVNTFFNEDIDQATMTSSTAELKNTLTNAVVTSTLTYNVGARRISITPNANLAVSTQYTVTIRGGGSDPRIKDLAGNALAASQVWSFTTDEFGYVPPTGAVARYGFEPKCPYCEGININDANAATATQLPAIVAGGKVGFAADFDGIDDLLSAKIKPTNFVADTYSFSFWVKPDAETLKSNKLTLTENLQSVNGSLYERTVFSAQQQSLITKRYSFKSSFDNAKGTNVGAIVAGQWNHVVMTYGTSRQKTYVNGVLVANTARTKPMISKFYSISIGGGAGYLFKGLIDEVFIFNTDIGQSGVTSLFGQTVN